MKPPRPRRPPRAKLAAARGRGLEGSRSALIHALQRDQEILENTFNSIADLVAVCDLHLCVIRANQNFAARLRLPVMDVIGRPLSGLLAADTAAWLASVAATRPHVMPTSEMRQISDAVLGGTFSMTATSLSTSEGQPWGTLLVARDVGEHAQLEAERARLRERLVQSEKLAALGQLVAGIAHELNNPLQGVLGHLELLRATHSVPRGIRRDFRTVYREADRAAKIVRNLLVFAGSQRLPRRRVSISSMISRVLALRARTWRDAAVEVVRQSDEILPRILGDPLLIQQALLNIVLNAEQSIASQGRGGTIYLSSVFDPDRRTVVVTIRDTGPGIPPDILPRIFEPFFSTKEVGRGTGLGLAITYGIVQEHGGQIHAWNHPEGGAVFTLELPASSLMVN